MRAELPLAHQSGARWRPWGGGVNTETGTCFPHREFGSWEVAKAAHESEVRRGCQQWQTHLPPFGRERHVCSPWVKQHWERQRVWAVIARSWPFGVRWPRQWTQTLKYMLRSEVKWFFNHLGNWAGGVPCGSSEEPTNAPLECINMWLSPHTDNFDSQERIANSTD